MTRCPDPRKRGSGLFFLEKGERRGDGGTDCHSQCAHWLRNDSFLQGMRYGGRTEASVPTEGSEKCGKAGRCGHRPLRRVERGAAKRAVGEIGEALPVAEEASRFRGSAPIGGHNSGRESVGTTVGNRRPLRTHYWWCGGTGRCRHRPLRRVTRGAAKRAVGDAGPYGRFARSLRGGRPQGSPLRKRYKGGQGRAESPSHGFAVPAPLGKGAAEDGKKQRLFDTIKPPPGAGALKGVCGEGGLRRGGLFGVGRF